MKKIFIFLELSKKRSIKVVILKKFNIIKKVLFNLSTSKFFIKEVSTKNSKLKKKTVQIIVNKIKVMANFFISSKGVSVVKVRFEYVPQVVGHFVVFVTTKIRNFCPKRQLFSQY